MAKIISICGIYAAKGGDIFSEFLEANGYWQKGQRNLITIVKEERR